MLTLAAGPQGTAADRQAARELYNEGYDLEHQRRYTEALDRFERSHAIFPAPTTALHIARCQAAQFKLATAMETYRKIVRLQLEDDAPEAFKQARKEASTELAELERGDVGATCTKRADCKKGLRCHEGSCAEMPKPDEGSSARETEEGPSTDKTRGADSEAGPLRRVIGLGVGFGGGVSAGTLHINKALDDTSPNPEVLLPTVEVSFFLPGEHAIAVYVPLVNDAVSSALVKGFAGNVDAVVLFNFGAGSTRFIAGAGVGVGYLTGTLYTGFGSSVLGDVAASGAAFRLPSEVGVEHLWDKQKWGIKFALRPWVEFATERVGTAPSNVNTTGGGVTLMITVTNFVTKRDTPSL